MASTAIGCVTAFETNLPRTLTSLLPLQPPPPPLLPPSALPRLVAATIIPRQARMAMATAMAPTAVVPTITVDRAMPTMKRCQLDGHLAAAAAAVMTYHHGRREPLMAATIELCSRQAKEETVSPLRLKTGATRMKNISVVLFSLFSVARNRVMAPLLMSCSFQPAAAAVTPAVISRGPRRSTAVITTATVPIWVRSSSTAAVVVVIVRNRSCDSTALSPQQQHGPRPFCGFVWEQRGACRDGPPVNGLANSLAQGQAQRDVEMDCHGEPVSKVFGPPETTASLARGGPPLQARHQRGLQPPSGTLSPPAAAISDSAFEEWLQSNEMEIPMFSQSKGQRQQPPNAAALVGGAPASSAVAAASAETSAAEPATSGTVSSAASIRGAVDARESPAGAVSSDAAAEAATSTGGTAAPVASAARAARVLASAAGSVDDSWAWAISQGRLRFYPRRRVSVRRLPPLPRPIPRSAATCVRLAHSRSWGGHSNEGSTLSRPGVCILGRVTSLAL